jgi:hypothetical protein
MVSGACGPVIQFVDHELVTNKKELDDYAEKVIRQGFPGIVLREPHSARSARMMKKSRQSLSESHCNERVARSPKHYIHST